MSPSQWPVWIVDGSSGEAAPATLWDEATENHIRDTEARWGPWMRDLIASHLPPLREESRHWDWRRKMEYYRGQLGVRSFAIECGGETQGLMIGPLDRCSFVLQYD